MLLLDGFEDRLDLLCVCLSSLLVDSQTAFPFGFLPPLNLIALCTRLDPHLLRPRPLWLLCFLVLKFALNAFPHAFVRLFLLRRSNPCFTLSVGLRRLLPFDFCSDFLIALGLE